MKKFIITAAIMAFASATFATGDDEDNSKSAQTAVKKEGVVSLITKTVKSWGSTTSIRNIEKGKKKKWKVVQRSQKNFRIKCGRKYGTPAGC